ncbi:MAG: GtrA family protein [Deltaproteobacteria bacterium]|nr:GtrA family protein [Deltaproteobacteria bacterium]
MVNIVSQDMVVRVYKGVFWLYVSIGLGTLTGLLVKYFLDKKYIFSYSTQNLFEDGQKFVLYSIMGICTTLIFWSAELGFEFFFGTKGMRYLGGVIGLCLGYWIKYNLDKQFVFVSRHKNQ